MSCHDCASCQHWRPCCVFDLFSAWCAEKLYIHCTEVFVIASFSNLSDWHNGLAVVTIRCGDHVDGVSCLTLLTGSCTALQQAAECFRA
jgi:hypothetical protein